MKKYILFAFLFAASAFVVSCNKNSDIFGTGVGSNPKTETPNNVKSGAGFDEDDEFAPNEADEIGYDGIADNPECDEGVDCGDYKVEASVMKIAQVFNSNLDELPKYKVGSSTKKQKFGGRQIVSTKNTTTFTIKGYGFGATYIKGSMYVNATIKDTPIGCEITSWKDDSIKLEIDALTYPAAITGTFSIKFQVVRPNTVATKAPVKRSKSRGCISTTQVATVTSTVTKTTVNGIQLNLKVLLGENYDAASSLMFDKLRIANLIPTTEPYTALGYEQEGTGGGETLTTAQLAVTGDKAIVDWVMVEFRAPEAYESVLYTKCAPLLRDGSIDLSISTIPQASYFVAVKHRNHLSVMTPTIIALGATAVNYDFTTGMNKTIDGFLKTLAGGKFGMVGGNASGNDPVVNIEDRILAWDNRNLTGYRTDDVDLDGECSAADRSWVWNNRNAVTIVD